MYQTGTFGTVEKNWEGIDQDEKMTERGKLRPANGKLFDVTFTSARAGATKRMVAYGKRVVRRLHT